MLDLRWDGGAVMPEHPYDRIDGPSRTDIAREDWEREHPQGHVTPFCERCDGIVAHLGTLGCMTWWRCIHCGWDTGILHSDLDPEVLEALDELDD